MSVYVRQTQYQSNVLFKQGYGSDLVSQMFGFYSVLQFSKMPLSSFQQDYMIWLCLLKLLQITIEN